MVFRFDQLLLDRGVELGGTRLVRHDRRGLAAWQRGPVEFDAFVSIQRSGRVSPYLRAAHAMQFVPGPPLADGSQSGLFVRAHRLGESWPFRAGCRAPASHAARLPVPDRDDLALHELEHLADFDDYAGRVLVRWGSGPSVRSWSQWAERQPKEVVELRRTASEPPFPGFGRLAITLDDVLVLPETWRAVLSSVGGVYLLVCPRTGEQYVGSASGAGGFLARWQQYAGDGHGGNARLRARRPENYSIAVLEVVSTDMGKAEVIARETAWKAKLGSRAHGLNAN
ncbi:MAG: GIY-YIG nuclease family protein [Planctomycetota bacterium]